MQKLQIFFLFFILLIARTSFSQEDPVILDYINTYKEIAISEMKRTGIPAAIKLAQGIHETEAGTSVLVKKSNNHFGLKCKSEWTGMTVSHTDDAPNECFRKYENAVDSYKDQSDYLKKTLRYASLFTLAPTNYSGWAYGLKKAGYATNPKYPQIIIKLIEDYHLQEYTLIALGKIKPPEESLVKLEPAKSAGEVADKVPARIVMEKPEPAKPASEVSNKIPPIIFMEKPVVMPPEPEIVVNVKKPARKETRNEEVKIVKEQNKTETAPVYPEGEFKINETRVIYAKKGTPYLTIADKYALPLARIFEFNDMEEQEFVSQDQLVYLMRKRRTGNNEQHIVKEGETLSGIAQTEAIRIESLLEYNFLKPGMKPVTGSVLYLRSKAPSMPRLASGK